jgi:transcriptional regulator with XRE-family HTH domain
MRILLEEYRKKRKLNQRELSDLSGVPQPMISEIENKIVKFPRVDTMAKLARALRCTVDDLIEE